MQSIEEKMRLWKKARRKAMNARIKKKIRIIPFSPAWWIANTISAAAVLWILYKLYIAAFILSLGGM